MQAGGLPLLKNSSFSGSALVFESIRISHVVVLMDTPRWSGLGTGGTLLPIITRVNAKIGVTRTLVERLFPSAGDSGLGFEGLI